MADQHAMANQHAATGQNRNANAHPDAHPHQNGDPDGGANPNSHPHPDPHGNSRADPHANVNADSYPDADAHPDPNGQTIHANANPDPNGWIVHAHTHTHDNPISDPFSDSVAHPIPAGGPDQSTTAQYSGANGICPDRGAYPSRYPHANRGRRADRYSAPDGVRPHGGPANLVAYADAHQDNDTNRDGGHHCNADGRGDPFAHKDPLA